MADKSPAGNPMKRVIAVRDFRLLFAGSATSLLGDQFALIATPWLVLQVTGDPLMLGLVLALEGVPRAAFMLVGGALTDRLSPRRIMLIADVIRLVLTAVAAVVVTIGAVQIWMLYAFGLAFGLVAGFAIPAQNSIVPTLIEPRDLQAGNSLVMGVTQLAGFVGPTVAGIVIGAHASSSAGIGQAFAIDAATYAVSAACLWLMRTRSGPVADESGQGLLGQISAGIAFLWNDPAMRLMAILLAALNFLLIGPLLIGIPLLAKERLPEGALAFGLLMSAHAGGNLIGYLLAGSLPRAGGKLMKLILLALLGGFALVIGSLSLIDRTAINSALLFLLGLGNGYVAIILFTWMQTRTPKAMLGRVMSILIFANTGLAPVSQALAGAFSKWSLDAMFVTAGALVVVMTAWAATRPELQVFADSLAASGERERTGP